MICQFDLQKNGFFYGIMVVMKHPLRWILVVVLFVLVSSTQKVFAQARTTPASRDPDINIRMRGPQGSPAWEEASFSRDLQDHTGFEDPKAPQLSTLIGEVENHDPKFTYFGKVKSKSGIGFDSSDSLGHEIPGIGSILADPKDIVYSPRQGYELGGGYSYVVLYATATDIVIHDTAEDSVARGYTIHLFDMKVDQSLLDLYNQNEANGRQQLVAIPCHAKLGTVGGAATPTPPAVPIGPDMRIIIRDTGSFMDFRYKDWWTMPVISNCKDIPPGLITPIPVNANTENPDIADKEIVDSQSHDLCSDVTNTDGTTSTVCRNSDVMQFNGSFYAPNNYIVPELDPHADMLQRAGAATTPLSLLDSMVDDTTCQRITTATRRCIYNKDGELVGDEISDDIISTDPLCWIPKIKQWSTEYSRYWGHDAGNTHDYTSEPIIINKDAAHPCDFRRSGENVAPTTTAGTGQITFDLFRLLQSVVNAILGRTVNGTMVEIPSKRTPYAEKGCAIGQCTDADLADSPIDPMAKSKYVNTAPFETSFHIPMLDPRPANINGQLENTFGTPGGGSFKNPTNTYFTKYTQNLLGYICSTLLPPAQQPDWCKPDNILSVSSATPTPPPRVPPVPVGVSQCNEAAFSEFQRPIPTGGGNGGPVGDLSGFTIAYRDPACTLPTTPETATRLADLAVRWYNVAGKPIESWVRQNVTDNWQKVQQHAVASGWNPAFVIMLWLEESAMGAAQTYQMGCIYGKDTAGNWKPAMDPNADACSEEACLFSHPTQDPNNLQAFMCSYNTGVCTDLREQIRQQKKVGDQPTINWGFANNIKFAYPLISDIGNLPPKCQLRTK
jgi:hypothetical protein